MWNTLFWETSFLKKWLGVSGLWLLASANHCPGHTSVSETPVAPLLPRCAVLCAGYDAFSLPAPVSTNVTVAEHRGPDLTTPTWRYDVGQPARQVYNPAVLGLQDTAQGHSVDEIWIRDENIVHRDAMFFAANVRPGLRGTGVELLRQAADGEWSTVATGDFEGSQFTRVSLAALGDTVALCGVTNSRDAVYSLWTARFGNATLALHDIELGDTRYARTTAPLSDGSYGSRGAGDVGVPKVIACAGVRAPSAATTELHVCLVTDDGHLYHAIRRRGSIGSDGFTEMWTAFGDVETQTGDMGYVTTVDCTAQGNALHLVAVGRLGTVERIWRSTRLPSGVWRGTLHQNGITSPRDDVLTTAFSPQLVPNIPIAEVAVGFCHQNGDLTGQAQLVIAFTYGLDVRYVLWQPAIRQWPPEGTGASTYSPVYSVLVSGAAMDSDPVTPSGVILGPITGNNFGRRLSVAERPFSHDPALAKAGR